MPRIQLYMGLSLLSSRGNDAGLTLCPCSHSKCLIAVNVDPTYTLSQKETLVDQYLYNKSITQDHAGGISNRSGKDVATAHLARVTHIDQYILQLQVLLARLAESRKGEPQRNTLLLRTKAVLHAMRKHLAETSTNDPVGPRHALSHPSLLPPPPTGLGAAYNTSVGLSWHGATTFYYLYSSRESVRDPPPPPPPPPLPPPIVSYVRGDRWHLQQPSNIWRSARALTTLHTARLLRSCSTKWYWPLGRPSREDGLSLLLVLLKRVTPS